MLFTLTALTYFALESGDVVIASTKPSPFSEVRETHIWFVQIEGALFLEAGSPENPWVSDLSSNSSLHLTNHDLDGQYLFVLHPQDSHDNIRRLMREKYGWRDWWISFFFDTSKSFMIEAQRVSAQESV